MERCGAIPLNSSGSDGLRIIRAMPNTPAQVGAGATAMCARPCVTPGELSTVRQLFEAVGTVADVKEAHMDGEGAG